MRIEPPSDTARGAWSRVLLVACLGLTGLAADPSAAAAQSEAMATATGRLLVRVRRADSTPIAGAFVRSGRTAGIADTDGVASLELPATLRTIVVTSHGFRPRSFEMTIVPHAPNRVEIVLQPARADEDAISTGLRREGRIADQAEAIDRLGSDQLIDASLGRPTDLIGALSRIDGAFPEPTNGPLGATRLRLFGAPGDLTSILVDGVPLLGGYPGSFGLVDLTPLEFSQIEIIRGAASAWFGPTAGVGAINLVSRRPDRNAARLQANQTSEKGGDIVFSGSARPSPTIGASIIADFHQQRLVDADEDNWGEFPRAIRFGIRPRLFIDRPNGDGLILTAGALTDDRNSGFLFNPNTGQDVYREERRARGANASLIGWRGTEAGGRLQLKLAVGGQGVSYTFDAFRQRDHRTSAFGELSYSRAVGPVILVGGVGYQTDALYLRDLVGYDYSYHAPAAFAQASVTRRSWSGSAAARCDRHNELGSQCSANLALLIRPTGSLRLQLSAGTGAYAPNLFTEETETADLRGLIPSVLAAERIGTATADLAWRRGRLELGGGVNFNRVSGAVRSVSVVGDTGLRATLVNLPEPTRVTAASLRLVYRGDRLTVRASYVHQTGSESDSSVGTARRDLDHLPNELASVDLGWHPGLGDGRVNFVARYVGEQALWDNPYRTRGDGYVSSDVILSQRTGRARLYLSAENLLDVKLRTEEPVILPVPWLGRRRTTSPWRPLRGRVLSLGATVEW